MITLSCSFFILYVRILDGFRFYSVTNIGGNVVTKYSREFRITCKEEIKAYDSFPFTKHTECAALMSRVI